MQILADSEIQLRMDNCVNVPSWFMLYNIKNGGVIWTNYFTFAS